MSQQNRPAPTPEEIQNYHRSLQRYAQEQEDPLDSDLDFGVELFHEAGMLTAASGENADKLKTQLIDRNVLQREHQKVQLKKQKEALRQQPQQNNAVRVNIPQQRQVPARPMVELQKPAQLELFSEPERSSNDPQLELPLTDNNSAILDRIISIEEELVKIKNSVKELKEIRDSVTKILKILESAAQ